MLGLLVVTHGGLADQLVLATERILGDFRGMKVLSIGWDDPVEVARMAIEESLHDVDDGDGVLILTDMFWGTPTNLSLAFLEKGRVEIVTGVNLPMLIKYANHRESYSLTRAAEELAAQGRDSIHVASVLLGNDMDAE